MGPSEDLALAFKGVKPIGTESVPPRFAAESQQHFECLGQRALPHAGPAAFLALEIVQGPILWHLAGTLWNLSGAFQ